MPEIHVRDGRLYSVTTPGLLVRKDELALLTEADGVAFVLSGDVDGGTTAPFSLTSDSRLRVETRADELNAFGGNAWAYLSSPFKSAW